MQLSFSNLISWQSLANLIDILVVWYVIYKLIMLIRGTKAVQLVKGIAVIVVVKLASMLLHLTTISFLMDQILTWGVIALVIVFQPEIRRGLEHLGRGSILQRASQDENRIAERMINELDKAIQYMAKRRIGALISIQMKTGLEDYIETGIPLDADISSGLLINIFIPNTPLHDGAVIIRDNRIAVAAAYLPLSESNTIPKELGTRHRAAVGISEVTDALTIVVSEETGGVTLTKNSQLMRDMSQAEYLKYLRSQFIVADKEPNQWDRIRDRIVHFFTGNGNGGDHHVD